MSLKNNKFGNNTIREKEFEKLASMFVLSASLYMGAIDGEYTRIKRLRNLKIGYRYVGLYKPLQRFDIGIT